MQESTNTIDIDSLWEYTNPAESEDRFRIALISAHGDERLELLTQIARTYGLRQRFDEAHDLLNQVEKQLERAGLRPRVRYNEIGRRVSEGRPDHAGINEYHRYRLILGIHKSRRE